MKILLLDNIRSMQNVWAIFRNCDGAGFEKIYLTGCTPTPPRNEISKTALSAETTVDWEYYQNARELIENLKQEGFFICSVELDTRSKDYKILFQESPENMCLVLWNEISWVNKEILEFSDEIVMIPMLGKKESLNVSVAAGIVMYATV
jgi:tRNA G18 (ribose-2'-O)-methylase SpoU